MPAWLRNSDLWIAAGLAGAIVVVNFGPAAAEQWEKLSAAARESASPGFAPEPFPQTDRPGFVSDQHPAPTPFTCWGGPHSCGPPQMYSCW